MESAETTQKQERSRCTICGAVIYRPARAKIAGAMRPVCPVCVAGALQEKAGWSQVPTKIAGEIVYDDPKYAVDGLTPTLHCLHLTALAVEHGIARLFPRFKRYGWAERGIASRVSRGVYRAECPCPTCRAEPPPVGGGADGLHERFGVATLLPVREWPVAVLKTFPDHRKLAVLPCETIDREVYGFSQDAPWRTMDELALRVVRNYDATARPPVVPGGLADRATPKKPGRWVLRAGRFGAPVDVYQDLNAAMPSDAEKAAIAHYCKTLRQYGGGAPDGSGYWVDADGVCHEWSPL